MTARLTTRVIDRLDALTLYARAILSSPSGQSQGLIRSELFGSQRFEEHGRSLAAAQTLAKSSVWRDGPTFSPRVKENIKALRLAYDYIATISQSGQYVTPAAEWLLDNFHLVEAQLEQIHEGVPRRYYADLPKITGKPLDGLPRVYGVAWAYVAHTDSVLDPLLFTAFLNAYQDVSELTLGELWALPTTLRVVLLENLRRVADQIAEGKAAREAAHALWENPLALSTDDMDELLALMQNRGLERVYLTQLWQRMPDHTPQSCARLERWIQEHCPNGLALVADSQTSQVASNLTISNIINSLRLIGQIEWTELIEPVSRSLRVLRELPSFSLESESTRQQITQAMEEVARDTDLSELAVAQSVVHLARRAPTVEALAADDAQSTAGYYLIGAGQSALLTELASRVGHGHTSVQDHSAIFAGLNLFSRFSTSSQPKRLAVYLALLLMGTAAVLWASARGLPYTHPLTWSAWPTWVALGLMAWPASEAIAAIMARVVAESTHIKPMPRLDFSHGIPAAHRVLVAVPCMLTSSASTRELTERLRLHWLASLEDNAQFALLSDWADAAQASLPSDSHLLKEAAQCIAQLNQAYPAADGKAARFLLIHRGRTWCGTELRWIGWERKRGKLELLIRYIVEPAGNHDFYIANGDFLSPGIAYILTLDSDTGLPPTSLRELVSIAAHPLNTPHIDTTTRRVTGGYGILQPRVVTPLPTDDERSAFHTLFAGQCGIDAYSNGTSDLYQDLFGLGTFTGKGLLHVRAMYAALDQRFQSETILSHDLLEGSVVRCAYVSDVILAEDHPHHAGVDASRQHRWTRGDWQLLPVMRNCAAYGIDPLGLWKMLDNLRRSLVPPAALALLVWVIFTDALPLSKALAVVLAAYLAGPLLGALASLVPTRSGIVWRHFFHVGMTSVWRSLSASTWQFSQLVVKSGLLLDAILRTLWRLAVSRRHLLQWTTAAQAQAVAKYTLAAFLKTHALATCLCLAMALLSWRSPHAAAGASLFVLWALAPVFSWWVSVPAGPVRQHRLTAPERSYLLGLAEDTWHFFERNVGPSDHWLPPDNLQIDAEPVLAHRTSPTNIGLYLLSVCCARHFGWQTTAQMVARLQSTLATVERLPKHDGHLFNWYQTETLDILQPAYVSTVDSGNLAGHLLAVAGACTALQRKADSTADEKQALGQIAAHCTALCMAMNFQGLYNAKRHLFHIGLRVHEQTLDASYYDLLASESRLASFLAIAKGDVPRRHWMALGRVFLSVGVTPGLKSWSGSMFEYLMPSLVMQEPELGLLRMSGLAAVAEQQVFGHEQAMPWGVSESAYLAQDHSLAYQYSPFGVPRLALRRTPVSDRVIAPYASMMALQFAPHEAIANLRRMQALGARGDFGFMDAIDFTTARQPHSEAYSVIKNYMAHHQGMALVALCNTLCGQEVQRWFSSTPLVRAFETLLHERCPQQIISSANPRTLPDLIEDTAASTFQSRRIKPFSGQWQPTHLLSNGRYSVALRPNGAGVSRLKHNNALHNINRWRDDALRDHYGSFIYLRSQADAPVHSLTAHPAPHPLWRYNACLMADRVQFDVRSSDFEASTTVLVSPEDDTEIRLLVLNNTTNEAAVYEVISCFEVVLADAKADEAHPAFSNLFIESTWHPAWRAIVSARRPRLHGDSSLACAHFLAETDADADVVSVKCLADRRAFLGRNRARSQPVIDAPGASNSSTPLPDGTPVNGLDPVACLRVTVRVPAGGVTRLTFATAAAPDKAALTARIDKYLQPMHIERATRMAATLAQVRLRDLGIDPDENAALQDLSTALMYSTNRSSTSTAGIDQRLLWRFGISGDKPILLVRIHASEGLGLVQSLLRAQPWWSFGGLATDVVVLNSEDNSYAQLLQREILAQRDRLNQKAQNSFPLSDAAGFYLLRDYEVSAAEKAALSTLARVIFMADGRPLETQVSALRTQWLQGKNTAPSNALVVAELPSTRQGTPLRNVSKPSGQFDAATGEFRFEVHAAVYPARPWVNVIANAHFGFQVSEAGSGYTWATNSRLNQITPWSNDPVEDPGREHYLLQDVESRQFLRFAPGSHRGHDATNAVESHQVRHGQGYSVFTTLHDQLLLKVTFFADVVDAVKLVHIELRNDGPRTRQLRALAMAEWQMGASLAERRTVLTWNAPSSMAVMAQQRESRSGFGGSTAFLALAGLPGLVQWTCDRSEFFDAAGHLSWPITLGQRAGGSFDPCGAVASSFKVAPGAVVNFTFVLGHASDAVGAEALASAWQRKNVAAALQSSQTFWTELLGRVQVSTPDALFDALVNRWLLYQTLTSRLWSKAGFYQAGGAFGFRDQLQDSMAFAAVEPQRLRAQIVLNASRQFAEGDVQHWWHAPGGEGVRTHFSDDLLWLPFACAHYIDVTGDAAVLDESVAFIEGASIPPGQEDAYYAPDISAQSASLYEHCARTLDRSLPTGTHGLPLMGTGDWNDGMNRVGHEGRGESVWLAWFLCSVVQSFAPLAEARGDTVRAATWRAAREGWVKALHTHGWDGQWFRRAFFDNGEPLGSDANAECKIDMIAQAWAVLSGASSDAYTQPAMQAMKTLLIDNSAGLMHLLTPPFTNTADTVDAADKVEKIDTVETVDGADKVDAVNSNDLAHPVNTHTAANNPGYIQAYPPGVRENGGQYNHAAVWALMAQAQSGDVEAAWESFKAISPFHRSAHPTRGPAYELEPYVMAGDIYGSAPYTGRGGWSWYTGSAAWLHRAALESMLGLQIKRGAVSLNPRVPAHWPAFEVTLKLDGRNITWRWQRNPQASTGDTPQAPTRHIDRTITAGEVVLLAELPQQAFVLVLPKQLNSAVV